MKLSYDELQGKPRILRSLTRLTVQKLETLLVSFRSAWGSRNWLPSAVGILAQLPFFYGPLLHSSLLHSFNKSVFAVYVAVDVVGVLSR